VIFALLLIAIVLSVSYLYCFRVARRGADRNWVYDTSPY